MLFLVTSLNCLAQNIHQLISDAEQQLASNHWEKASNAFQQILTNYEDQLTYLQLAEIYNHLGYLNLLFLDPEEAERDLNRSLTYHEEAGIPDERSYADALINTGMMYLEHVEFDLARSYVKRALGILETREEWNIPYLVARSKLARIYEESGSYTLALSIYNESYDELIAIGNDLSPDFAEICAHKGRILILTGSPREGEKFISLSTTIYESLGPNYHVQRAESMEDLALFYEQMGRYEEAEILLLEILSLKRSIPDEADILIIETLNDLGIMYNRLGRYLKAEQMFKEVIEECEEHAGMDHPFYATAKNNLGTIALNNGNYSQARVLLKDALERFKSRFGSFHPYYADVLNNLARTERKLGHHTIAESYYAQVLKIDFKLYGDQHPNYATTLLNIGILLSSTERESEAESYYETALAIREKSLGKNHPAYGNAVEYTGIHYLAVNKLVEAERKFRESIEIQINQIRALFPIMNEQERELFYQQIHEDVARYTYVASQLLGEQPDLIQHIFDFQVKTKTLLFNSLDKVHDLVMNSEDALLIAEYEQWLSDKHLIASYYQMGRDQLAELHVNLSQIEAKINVQERYLMKRIDAFAEALPYEKLGWQHVLDIVKKGEAVVEIVKINEFEPLNNGIESIYGFSGRCKYMAILFNSEEEFPNYTFLGDTSESGSNPFVYCQNLSVSDQYSEEIFKAYWKPIMDLTEEAESLRVVPDGFFYQLNPNQFKVNKKDYVFDTQYVSYLSSTYDLLKPEVHVINNKYCELSAPRFKALSFSEFDLSVAGNEAELNVSASHPEWKISSYHDQGASEYRLRSLYFPTILHISVPAFFDSKTQFISEKTPLVSSVFNSGLFFAGVMDTYEKYKGGIPSISENDGILTAYEAMKLELDRTRLVFLSSVSLDSRDFGSGEGMFGLIRALTVGGARSVIASIRKIDPEMKREFLELFYNRVFETNLIQASFKYAQQEMKKRHKEVDSWGAFVLTGGGN